MPLNPNSPAPLPLIEVFENLAPPVLHAAAWATCMGSAWRFGHGSVSGGDARFWQMDLSGAAAFEAIWEHTRARCEELAGDSLRVIRQYANGHTYGMGGNIHRDDLRADTFTLLYYPNPEWQDEWEGETVFYGDDQEILLSIRLRPNRAVFFDSRIPHRGRGPSRSCPNLRVSVAYKLERTGGGISVPAPSVDPPQAARAVPEPVREISREGAKRVYTAQIAESVVDQAVRERLTALGESVRLPGFRPGKIPPSVLEQRYGAEARAQALKRLAAHIVETGLPQGSVASACELVSGAESGPLEIRISATHLPDLSAPDLSRPPIERLTFRGATPEQSAFLESHLSGQVLDRLDAAYAVPLFPGIVDREFNALWKSAESRDALPEDRAERAVISEQLRVIADRRLRLGCIIAELARRFGIKASDGPALEAKTIRHLLTTAPVAEREITAAELAALMKD